MAIYFLEGQAKAISINNRLYTKYVYIHPAASNVEVPNDTPWQVHSQQIAIKLQFTHYY
jgi:hypothetical protein